MHTNLTNKKKYVGITKNLERERWCNGVGYKANKKFYKDIEKYGWDGFSHEIIKDNLTYKEARELETAYINQYDLIEKGYNNGGGTLGSVFHFDFYNFNPLDNEMPETVPDKKYFTRFPNFLVQCNIQKKYGLHRIFYLVYILIDRHRSYEDQSYITISEIFEMCRYKRGHCKPKIFFEIIKCLLFLHESSYIQLVSNIDVCSIDYDECIRIRIIPENFDAVTNFCKISSSQLETIIQCKSGLSTESILTAFLYINSYIFTRPRDEKGMEVMFNPETKPEAFWRSIDSMAKELAMSKDTINQCINYLTSPDGNQKPLLIKKEVGSVQPDPNKPPRNVPNIYVLNKEGYQQEIEWALCKMLEIYGLTKFEKLK